MNDVNIDQKSSIKKLREEIALLQRHCRELGIPVLMVFEGLSTSGKGTLSNQVIQPMDPRGFKVSCIAKPSRDEKMRPFLWRFWRRMPSANRMAIFDRSWYRVLLDGHVSGDLDPDALGKAYADVRAFECQIKDGGVVILKFHLDITREEQRKRLERLRSNPVTAWRAPDEVLARHFRFEEYKHAIGQMLEETDRPEAPWMVIDCNNIDDATHNTLDHIARRLRQKVADIEAGEVLNPVPNPDELPSFPNAPRLEDADLSKSLEKEEYNQLLEERQERIRELHHEIYQRRIPVVLVYEGWDAAGKGGNIRRLTQRLDPRGYEVIPVAAPNDIEKAHHYLWRFWTEFPKAGHITIFDRSWYGRVLVERVEGFCSEADWKRAYKEINEMEENFHHFGSIVLKFWVQIDMDEQLERFRSRETNPHKQWKLNEEDWRNREKWSPYQEAVDEMFLRTHTEYAPWTVIEGNCKLHARIQALDTVIGAISERLRS